MTSCFQSSRRRKGMPQRQSPRALPVCTENLNPNVLMMKSAQDSVRTYHAGSLYRPRNRRIFVQRSMRSDAVVIIGVRFQNPAQMLLAEDNEVIQTLTPDRSDQ